MKKFFIFIACIFVFSGACVFSESIVIKGSTTVLPIAQEVIEKYMEMYPDVKISLSGGGSGNGLKAIIDNSCDIANSSRFIKDKEIKRSVENGAYPVPFRIAYDCIIPIVNQQNPIDGLDTDQLKDIYTGKVKNWNQVGGFDKSIVVISRDTSSGTYEVWEKEVMKKERVFPRALLQASNGAVIQAVSRNKYAIGYIGIGYLDKSVKPLLVNGIEGNKETTLDGTFPISRPLFMFTRGWPEGRIVHFINFVLNPLQGQKLVEKSGYVPLY